MVVVVAVAQPSVLSPHLSAFNPHAPGLWPLASGFRRHDYDYDDDYDYDYNYKYDYGYDYGIVSSSWAHPEMLGAP